MGASAVYFDLETRNLFEDIEPMWKAMSWNERDANQRRLCAKLGVAVAGLGVDGRVEFFEEDEVELLVRTLAAAERIVGHNLLGFDYPVLTKYVDAGRISKLEPRTVDTLKLLHGATGVRIGLDDLAKLNLGRSKTDDPRMVPQLWRSGQHDRVKSYLRSDVELTRDIYQFGVNKGVLRYTHKDWQRGTHEIREVACPWAAPGVR
jgi:DEAD/DEAH box helicase domain-containing protein